MGIIDKFDDTVRLNLRRFGLTALPLFSVTVALNAPQESALLLAERCIARHSIYWRILHPLPRIQRLNPVYCLPCN